MADAGYPHGQGFPPFAFLYNNGEQNQYIGVELKSMFERELGVEMGLRPQENKAYLTTMSNLDYDLARSSWIGDYNDPNTFLDMWVTGGGNNRCGWSSRAYDALIADAARETDPARRFDLFRRAETLLVREAVPICPLYFYVGIQLYHDDQLAAWNPTCSTSIRSGRCTGRIRIALEARRRRPESCSPPPPFVVRWIISFTLVYRLFTGWWPCCRCGWRTGSGRRWASRVGSCCGRTAGWRWAI